MTTGATIFTGGNLAAVGYSRAELTVDEEKWQAEAPGYFFDDVP